MHLLVLGRGKTGSLVAEVARERRHHVRVFGYKENQDGCGLTSDVLKDVDAVIDFTSPTAVLCNIEACLREKKNMVVGTTGWHGEMARIRFTSASRNVPATEGDVGPGERTDAPDRRAERSPLERAVEARRGE